MLPRGRPPAPGTAEEKAAIRREKVRLNVKAYRERKRSLLTASYKSSSSSPSSSSPPASIPAISEPIPKSEDEAEQDHPKSETYQEYDHVIVKPGTRPKSNLQLIHRGGKSQAAPQLMSPWCTPDSSPMVSLALLAVFRNQFLPLNIHLPSKPREEGGSHLITPCSPWIMAAYNMALQQDSSALRSGLLAVGLILNGQEYSNDKLNVASIQMHQQALRKLQRDIGPIALRRPRGLSATNIIAPYLSCLAVAMFELIQNGFSPVIIQHVKALNSLIELMYADPSLDKFTTTLIMEDFGMLEMMFCLKYGFSSVLKDTRRKLGLRRADGQPKDESRQNGSMCGDLLDIVEDLPSLICQVKALQLRPASEQKCQGLRDVTNLLLEIQGDLDAWKIRFELDHNTILIYESFSDELTGQRGARNRLRSYEHGAAGLLALYFQLNVVDTAVEAITSLAQDQELLLMKLRDDQPEQGMVVPSSADGNDIHHTGHPNATENRPRVTGDGTLYDQLRAQRIKDHRVIRALIEVMSMYSKMVVNLSGRSLMANPSDLIGQVLEKEQQRLEEDLHRLQAEEHEKAVEIYGFLSNVKEARRMFLEFVSDVQPHDSAST